MPVSLEDPGLKLTAFQDNFLLRCRGKLLPSYGHNPPLMPHCTEIKMLREVKLCMLKAYYDTSFTERPQFDLSHLDFFCQHCLLNHKPYNLPSYSLIGAFWCVIFSGYV